MPPLLPILSALVAAGSLALLVGAWRGRRINDHPICRRCGFDLFGLPPGAGRCSECGGDLSRRRAVRIGQRARHRGIVAIALASLLVSLSFLSGSGYVIARQIDPQHYKPVWWLAREARSPSRAAAIDELRRRLSSGKLSNEQIRRISEQAMAALSDPGRPWVPAWDAWLHDALRRGHLGPERWKQFALESLHFHLDVRPVVARGEPVALRLTWNGHSPFDLAHLKGEIRLSEQAPLPIRFEDVPASAGDFELPLNVASPMLRRLGKGPHTVHVTLHAELEDLAAGRNKPQSVDVNTTLSGDWKMVTSVQSAALVGGDEKAEASAVSVRANAYRSRVRGDRLHLIVSANHPPLPLACRVLVRRGSYWQPVGFLAAPSDGETTMVCDLDMTVLKGGTLDVMLDPHPLIERQSVFLMARIWGNRIVEAGVPVRTAKGNQPTPLPAPRSTNRGPR